MSLGSLGIGKCNFIQFYLNSVFFGSLRLCLGLKIVLIIRDKDTFKNLSHVQG